MAWITDGEAVPRQRLSGVPHVIGRVFRYLGWVLVLPVTIVGWLYRRFVKGGKAPELHHPSAFARYGNWLQGRPWLLGSIALIVMLVIAIPMLSLRLGFSDDGGTAPGTPPRIAYDLTAEGFGPGVNGPFYIAVELPEAGNQDAVDSAHRRADGRPGCGARGGTAGGRGRHRRADPAVPDDRAAGRGDHGSALPRPRRHHPGASRPTPVRRRTSVASRR